MIDLTPTVWCTNNGPLVRAPEMRLSGLVSGDGEARYVKLASGISAVEVGLRARGTGAGLRVLLPALTIPATAQIAARCRAEPVFADVCSDRRALTPELAREVMAHVRVHAGMPVATFGGKLPADVWDALSRDNGVPVLFDAAAALGQQPTGRVAHQYDIPEIGLRFKVPGRTPGGW